MPRTSSDQLADNLHDVMMDTLPSLVKEKVTEQVKKEVPAQAQISSQIQNAVDNAIPSLVDASVRSYMSGHILHVHPAQVQSSSVPEQQHQLYLAMNADPLPFAVRTRDQDDPHDDAHPEGENSAKRQKTSEYEVYVSGVSSSRQVNVEEPGPSTSGNQEQDDEFDFWTDSYASDDDEIPTKQITPLVQSSQRDPEALALSLINQDLFYLKKRNSGPEKIVLSLYKFLAIVFNDDDIKEWTSSQITRTSIRMTLNKIEEYDVFSIVYEPVHGIIYTNRKKEKRVMRHLKIHKFCDATLRRTLEGLKSYYNDVKYGYVQKELTNDKVEFLKLFEEEIKVPLNYRDQMRRWEIEILGLDGCFMSCPWSVQILTAVGVNANNGIYPVAYAIVEAESKAFWCWFLNLRREDLDTVVIPSLTLTIHRDLYKPLHLYFQVLNIAKATSVGEFNKKMGRAKCDLLLNNICEVFNRQLVDGRDQPIITCLKYIREYLMKRLVVVQKVIAKTIGPLTPSVTTLFIAIKKPTDYIVQWNRAGGSSQAGARQDAGATNVYGQAVGSRNALSQVIGSSQPSAAPSTATGARNASSQAAGASQPSAALSTVSQGPTQHSAGHRQGFHALRPAPSFRP
ncbi:integrase, catalytic region, zinc finger, CCHC-type containing protein [Tanacetum coccineum]